MTDTDKYTDTDYELDPAVEAAARAQAHADVRAEKTRKLEYAAVAASAQKMRACVAGASRLFSPGTERRAALDALHDALTAFPER